MLGDITPEEESVLDRSIHETYAVRDITAQSNLNLFTPELFPTMTDFYEVLRNMDGGERPGHPP